MANTRIPNKYLDDLLKTNLPPQIKALLWFYRNFFGWNSNFKQGFFQIKNLSIESEKIGLDIHHFRRALIELQTKGLLSFDKKIFTLTHQKGIEFDPKKGSKTIQKKINKRIENDPIEDRKRSKRRIENDPIEDRKRSHDTQSKPLESSRDKGLKHSLKQDLKASLKASSPACARTPNKSHSKKDNFIHLEPQDNYFEKIKEIIDRTPFDRIPESIFNNWSEEYGVHLTYETICFLVIKVTQKKMKVPDNAWNLIETALSQNWIAEMPNQQIIAELQLEEQRRNKIAEEQISDPDEKEFAREHQRKMREAEKERDMKFKKQEQQEREWKQREEAEIKYNRWILLEFEKRDISIDDSRREEYYNISEDNMPLDERKKIAQEFFNKLDNSKD